MTTLETSKSTTFLRLALALVATFLCLAAACWAQTENVLHDFTGVGTDGSDPLAGLAMDSAGNLYGTAGFTVFEVSPTLGGGWSYNPIFTFTQGRLPESPLLIDASGNLYGTTLEGGTSGGCNSGEGCGIVYELSQTGGVWSETVLYNFTGGSDGGSPVGNLAMDATGNLYGTASIGGDLSCSRSGLGCGVVFELSNTVSGWEESVLRTFTDKNDGAVPMGGVTLDAAGNVYGTASRGGNVKDCPAGQVVGCGVVFKLTSSSSGWTEQVLHSFTENNNGYYPQATVTFDPAGNIYGTTMTGGGVYRLTPTTTGPWKFAVLKILSDLVGASPLAGVTLDSAGNVYGTTNFGGDVSAPKCDTNGCGVVFKLTPTATGPWTETAMHIFKGGTDGRYPFYSGVVLDSSGNLYGVTEEGGALARCSGAGCGLVYQIVP